MKAPVEVYDLEKTRNYLVAKANIINMASYKLSVNEQRIILTLISMVEPADDDFKLYRVDAKECIDLLGLKSKNPEEELRRIIGRLKKKELTIVTAKSELDLNWLASAEYFKDEGHIELEISQKLRPYLLSLKKAFMKYRLKNIIQLRSEYSIRIYELLKQRQKLGKAYFEYPHLRKILGLAPAQYKRYPDFRNRVLLQAQRELEKKTDITFTFEEVRVKRKNGGRPDLKGIEFSVMSSKRSERDRERATSHYESDEDHILFDRLIQYYSLTASEAKDALQTYDSALIERNLRYVERRYKNKGLKKIENIRVYTLAALQNDYAHQDTLFDNEDSEAKEVVRKENSLRSLVDRLEREYQHFYRGAIADAKEKLSEREMKTLKIKAEQEVKQDGPGVRSNPLLRADIAMKLNEYLEKKFSIESEEEWTKQRVMKNQDEFPELVRYPDLAQHVLKEVMV